MPKVERIEDIPEEAFIEDAIESGSFTSTNSALNFEGSDMTTYGITDALEDVNAEIDIIKKDCKSIRTKMTKEFKRYQKHYDTEVILLDNSIEILAKNVYSDFYTLLSMLERIDLKLQFLELPWYKRLYIKVIKLLSKDES
jgi:hypothetical protein